MFFCVDAKFSVEPSDAFFSVSLDISLDMVGEDFVEKMTGFRMPPESACLVQPIIFH